MADDNEKIRKILQDAAKVPASPDFERRLYSRLRSHDVPAESRRKGSPFRIPAFAYSAVAVVIVCVIAYSIFRVNVVQPPVSPDKSEPVLTSPHDSNSVGRKDEQVEPQGNHLPQIDGSVDAKRQSEHLPLRTSKALKVEPSLEGGPQQKQNPLVKKKENEPEVSELGKSADVISRAPSVAPSSTKSVKQGVDSATPSVNEERGLISSPSSKSMTAPTTIRPYVKSQSANSLYIMQESQPIDSVSMLDSAKIDSAKRDSLFRRLHELKERRRRKPDGQ